MNIQKILLGMLCLNQLSLNASADFTLTFENDASGFSASGFSNAANTTVAWSADNGGSLKLTNNRGATADPEFSWITKLFLNASQSSPAREVYNELVLAIANGGTISYDVITTSSSVTVGGGSLPSFAEVNLFAENQNGSFDNVFKNPEITTFPIGATTVQNVVIQVQKDGTKSDADNLAYFLGSTGNLQLGFGTSYNNADGFAVYIDNFKITPNLTKKNLFDFETGLQGWSLVSGATNATVTAGTNIPASPNKVMSLNRTTDAAFKWVATVSQNTAGQALFDALSAEAAAPVANAFLTFDVIYRSATITGGTFANVSVAINDSGGYQAVHGLGGYGSGDYTKNVVKRVRVPLASLNIDPGSGFYSMEIALNGNWTGGATINIDNIAIESPPPAIPVITTVLFDYETGLQGWGLFPAATDTVVSLGTDIPAAPNDVMTVTRATSGYKNVARVEQDTAGQAMFDAFTAEAASPKAGAVLKFDVIYRASDIAGGTFANISLAVNDSGGQTQINSLAIYGSSDFTTDKTRAVSIPLADLGIQAGSFFQMIFAINGDWTGTAGIHFDNIRIEAPGDVPAPSVPLVVTGVSKSGNNLTATFTGKPANAANWLVKGTSTLISFPDDMTPLSVITEPSAGSYQAVVDVTGKGPKYFVRIE